MTRKRVIDFPVVYNWDQADNRLRLVGELQMYKRVKVDRAQLKINEIKEELKKECAAIDDDIEKYELGLKAFCEAERAKKDFKSKVLTFGSVFFRKRSSLKILKGVKWTDVVEQLLAKKMERFLKTTHAVKKDDLRQSDLTDEVMAELGTKRHSEWPFTYELNETKFKRSDGADDSPARRAASA